MKTIILSLCTIFILNSLSIQDVNSNSLEQNFSSARCENLIFTNIDLFLENCDLDKTYETILNIKKWRWNL